MYARTLHRVLTTLSLVALVPFATTAVAQRSSAIGNPISGGAGSAPAAAPAGVRPAIMPGTLVVPDSSRAIAADLGKKAHTNFVYINPGVANPLEAPPYGGYAYETPSSLGCVYHMSTAITGCNPNSTTAVISGGSKAIAIVDAFDDPEAAADLAYFSAQFGIPFSVNKFQVVYANGYQPDIDISGGWELEEALDVEWAHAMAPGAMLYLVEAGSNSYTDLFTAVTVATNLVQCGSTTTCGSVTGAGEVSMSWGGGEFSGQTANDPFFNMTNVVFFASSGDSPGPSYPSTSPNVVSVGGSSIARNLSNANYYGEIAWSDAGSGLSAYEAKPSYQAANATVSAMVGNHRGTPDVSADANPYTGVWVYNTMPSDFYFSPDPWWIVGGTSVSSPVWAGIVNNAAGTNGFATSSNAELTRLYANLSNATTYAANFKDVNYGFCYFYMGLHSGTGYDLCTGIGTPIGKGGK